MYRNVYYSPDEKTMYCYTWDENGNRITTKEKYQPFLYIESNRETKVKSIFNKSLHLIKFADNRERNKYVDECGLDVYFNIRAEEQYLLTRFWKTDTTDALEHPLRIFYIDIECPSESEFPNPTEAKFPINVVTIYDTLTDKFHVWGEKPFDVSCLEQYNFATNEYLDPLVADRVVYHHHEDEAERLRSLLRYWSRNYPDIVSNWNGEAFDIPYLVNRLTRVLGKNAVKKLSPNFNVRSKKFVDGFGNEMETYKIGGISMMDYLRVFKVFTFNKERESWKLDEVASSELGVGKIEYNSSNLFTLARDDWARFVAYNIQDVNLLVGLDRKQKFMEFSRVCAYEGCALIEDAVGKTHIITGAVAKMALQRGQVLLTKKAKTRVPFEGGFVKQPDWGIHTNLISYDITSLYPTNMIICNMSPETKRGCVLNWGIASMLDDPSTLYEVQLNGTRRVVEMTRPQLKKFCQERSLALTGAGYLFSLSTPGIVSDFVKHVFDKKQAADDEKKMLKNRLEKEISPDDILSITEISREIDRCELSRSLWKVLANSIYGVVATNVSPLYDLDIARSVTLTGQTIIQQGYKIVRDFSKTHFGIPDDVNMIVASDTDSMMVTMTPILNSGKLGNMTFFEDNKLTQPGKKLLDVYQTAINEQINQWARDNMYTIKPLYNFEREKVCPAALFVAKKNYAYHVLNNEGKDCDIVKYTGLRTVKSEYSKMAKGILDKMYTYVLKNYEKLGSEQTRRNVVDLLRNEKKVFVISPPDDIVRRQKANRIDTWFQPDDPFLPKKGCTVQAKSAIMYNAMLTELKLTGKYPFILSGDKVKWGYVKPNRYDVRAIGYSEEMPEEFGLEIDVEKQFEKIIGSPVDKMFEVLGWRKADISIDDAVDLYDFFSGQS